MEYTCDKCNGTGRTDHDTICKKCLGKGQLNWIENVFGKIDNGTFEPWYAAAAGFNRNHFVNGKNK